MLFWHLGATLFLFRWIFRDPQVDVRLLAVGALLPDLVDLVGGTFLGFGRGELWMHSLTASSAMGASVLVLTRRRGLRRPAMTVVVGMLLHLVLDLMWTKPEVFWWPFSGPFEPGQEPLWRGAWERAWGDPWRWVRETMGMAYLGWLAVGHGLTRREGWRRLMRDGVLRPVGG